MQENIRSYESGVLPEGVRIYAVGDIHGRLDLVQRLIVKIQNDDAERPQANTSLIFVGDYIDRGPDSKGVVDYLLAGLPSNFKCVFLKGNHEQLLLDFATDPLRGMTWLANGGDAALLSYGVDAPLIRSARLRDRIALRLTRDMLLDVIPENHAAFYETLHLFHQSGGYFFVHGGVKPNVPLASQDEDDLLWIRDEFLNWKGDFGAVVVHGHTPVNLPENRVNRIGIDTYAFRSGRLTAVGLEGKLRWFLST